MKMIRKQIDLLKKRNNGLREKIMTYEFIIFIYSSLCLVHI